ncbi:DUF5906 domain-containing protein [Gemmobacter nectariphilus]|uniref:DUF5906 domain-containing protein n=1 Tax=Gemmobacter nectariphilus TaxID=220343 RepID=UPI0003FF0BDA|nr:DUF5906 domain-containing protein [Gemmobacter nectariphilus]
MSDFLRGWSENGPWWPTAIPREGGGTVTRTFTDLGELSDWARGLSGVKNLYFHVNDLSPDTHKKGEKGDVTRIRGLHVDVDARVPDGGWPKGEPTPERLAELTAHGEAERRRIRRIFEDWEVDGRKLPFPRPTAVIDSGGGFQGFWRFEDDEEVGPDVAEALNRLIAGALGGDMPTVDVSRLMRLPGAVNLPGQKKRWRGRTDAPTRLVWADWSRRFRASDFPAPAPAARATGGGGGAAPVTLSANLPQVSLDDLPDAVDARTRALIVNGEDPDAPGRYPSRSEVLFAVLCQLARAGVDDDTMAALILDPDHGVSAHVREQPRPEQYVARQIARARDAASEPELAELNERHVVLLNEQDKTRVLEFVRREIGGQSRSTVSLQSFEDFRNRYLNRTIKVATDREGNAVMKPLGATWLAWPHRRQAHSLVFAPGGGDEVGDQLNLWRGFGVVPAPGDWSRMRAHVREVLAGGDPEAADYIERWAAFAVQNPEAPAEVALVFRGKKGTGKGIFARALMRLFGQHGLHIPNGKLLTGNFNLHLRDCCLLFADEVEWHGDRQAEATLKVMVTEPELMIEGKGRDAYQSPNHLHIVMSSNEDWVVPASIDERRFAAFAVSDARKGQRGYFTDLVAEMDGGGLAAMLHDLLGLDLGEWHPRWNIPQTDELMAQKLASVSGPAAVALELLMRGETPLVEREDGRWPTIRDGERVFIPTSDLASWAAARRLVPEVRPGLTERLGHELSRAAGPGAEAKRETVARRQVRGWWLPALPEARRLWAGSHGLAVDWGEADGASWDVVAGGEGDVPF